jgi:mono/diheme cytochrome c family protein
MEKPTHESRKTLVNLVRIVVIAVFCAAIPRMSNAQNANRMYSEKCASCHAADGSAHTAAATKMAVPDLRTKRVRQMSDDDLYAATAEGKGHTSYPHAFLHTGLTGPQIRDLIKYIRTLGADHD